MEYDGDSVKRRNPGRRKMMIATLMNYLSYPFVRYAVIVGILVALCSALLGVVLVLKRFSFIGDGLSHVAFGALAIASVANLSNNTWLVLAITMAAAVIILRTGQNPKINGDAAIALVSVSALALGYMLLSVAPNSTNVSGDVCSTLFGSSSILTLRSSDVKACILLSLIVIGLFVVFYNKIFSITFDESFAKASGIRAQAYNLLIAVITATVIVVGMNLVGSLLVSALIIFPALSVMRLFRSFRAVVVGAGVYAIVCSSVGMAVSLLAGTPVGATIVIVDLVVFLICSLIAQIVRGN